MAVYLNMKYFTKSNVIAIFEENVLSVFIVKMLEIQCKSIYIYMGTFFSSKAFLIANSKIQVLNMSSLISIIILNYLAKSSLICGILMA